MTINVITPDRDLENFAGESDISIEGWDYPAPGHIDIGCSKEGSTNRYAPHRYAFLLDKKEFDRMLVEARKLGWVE